jgi:hypothetical protein
MGVPVVCNLPATLFKSRGNDPGDLIQLLIDESLGLSEVVLELYLPGDVWHSFNIPVINPLQLLEIVGMRRL